MNDKSIDDIFEHDVMDRLRTALPDASILDGWLVHYADDLLNGRNGVSFPCVAAQLGDDDITGVNGTHSKGNVTRTVDLIGAVSTVDPKTVSRQLNALVLRVRSALAVDEYSDELLAKKLTFSGAKYDLPTTEQQYAYFKMHVMIEYMEHWK